MKKCNEFVEKSENEFLQILFKEMNLFRKSEICDKIVKKNRSILKKIVKTMNLKDS